jgi:hypothetical protein
MAEAVGLNQAVEYGLIEHQLKRYITMSAHRRGRINMKSSFGLNKSQGEVVGLNQAV